LSRRARLAVGLATVWLMGCGPRAHIPPFPPPASLPGALDPGDSAAILARAIAPLLYIQRDEWFPLERVVAVVHPRLPLVAYHLLWRDDVHGSWIPFTVPTDEEVLWVGYDSTRAPTDVWTFWHGTLLHTDWRDRGQVAIDVQWGKHGSLPRGIRESDLPRTRTLNFFYASTIFLLPDIWLGDLTRKGPAGFFHSYRRYRDFSKTIMLSSHLDAITITDNPDPILRAVFGKYSHKPEWPQGF